ncbi:MAG: tRNA (adenine(22)-N(1))-methyltransferase [Peptococcales bacterium]|jgi:tRNA (adenine22-N1)-methyltransferase
MIKLSKRLKQIADFVPLGSIVADIGTDHAFLPTFLVQKDIVPQVIAIDVNKGPLEIAKKQVEGLLLSDKISVRLGDGLTPIIPGEVQTVVIAGMGGATMKKILTQSPQVVAQLQRIILQPNVAAEFVRKWAIENNWKIVDEELIYEDDRFYEIIVLEPGKMKLEDNIYLFLGPRLVEKYHIHLVEYLKRQKEGDLDILNELENSSNQIAKEKAQAIKDKWEKVKQVIKCRFNVEI